jgi:3-methyladenine DNA glycosylase AlkD
VRPEAVLDRLRAAATPEALTGLHRYGIPDERAFGVAMRDMQAIAKAIGKDQALAEALWETGWYEARTVAVFLAEPARLARARADTWIADFDNWAICDTACFHLFDRTPWAWAAVPDWMAEREEFVRRAGFALVWALALHDKAAPDAAFHDALRLIESAEPDARPLVRKAAEMALGAVARRPALTEAAAATARRMAGDSDPGRAWIGRTALRGIEKARDRKT